LSSDSLVAADDSVWIVDDQLDQPADPQTDDEAVATQVAVDEVMNELGMTNDPKLRTTSLDDSVKTTAFEDHADAVDAVLGEELAASL
jgi:hypothetical protein